MTANAILSWTYYVRRVNVGKSIPAGTWAAAIYLTGGIAAVGYITNHWLLVVGVIATFIGTSFSVWLDLRTKKKI